MPAITLTPAAAERLAAQLPDGAALRLVVPTDFRYGLEICETLDADDTVVEQHGVRLVLDPPSASRADGLTLDVDGFGGFRIDNPREPRVRELSVEEYAAWRHEGRRHHLIDVRQQWERDLARIEGSRLLGAETARWLEGLPRDTTLVFQCHHGVRSAHAARQALSMGFTAVYNLTGGIAAWSARVDPSVPTY